MRSREGDGDGAGVPAAVALADVERGLRRRRLVAPMVCAALLMSLAMVLRWHPTPGMRSLEERARPELRLGIDKITPRKAAMLRMGLLTMSPDFVPAAALGSDSRAAHELHGQAIPAPERLHAAGPKRPPSTALLPETPEVSRGMVEISLVCPSRDLFDEKTGIVANPTQLGRDWERAAWMSARRGGTLLVESPVGLRVHGGFSRNTKQHSFRVVFRESHGGHAASPPGLFFGDDTPPAVELVLSNAAHPSRFNSALAMEIAALAGCQTSRGTPAVVYVNGSRVKAPYFIYQHQSEHLVQQRYGIPAASLDWVRLKTRTPTGNADYIQWRRWIRRERWPISMREEGERFHLEDLSAWVLAMTFTATTDNNQGAYFRDRHTPGQPWRTLTWDMDQSFNDSVHVLHGRQVNFRDTPFDAIIGDRAKLFFRLIEGSAEYRDYFRSYVRDKVRRHLTHERMMNLVDKHVDIARQQPDRAPALLDILEDTRAFLTGRQEAYLHCVEKRLHEAALAHRRRVEAVAEN